MDVTSMYDSAVNDTTESTAPITISVVVPVYNSADIVETTIDRTIAAFETFPWELELILVNDGSSDSSWPKIRNRAAADDRIIAIDLLRNYGQHNANLCGIRQATGDWLVTMDDDLQNPPEEIEKLMARAMEGYDLVFGEFDSKKASKTRTAGSGLIARMNTAIFDKPDDLIVSNFRLMERAVYERIAASNSAFPYITGQSLMYSANRANALVRHDARTTGESNYHPLRIAGLVLRILFSYSSAPLRLVGIIGALIAAASVIAGIGIGIRGLFTDEGVAGWTSTIVLLSLLNGVVIFMLGMLGEYLIRTLQQVSHSDAYHVRDSVGRDAIS